MKQEHNIGKNLDSEKSKDIRQTNIVAARAVADVVRTSLGPRGMDKMVSFYIYLFIFFLDLRLKWKSVNYK
jgi:hypothetical protein